MANLGRFKDRAPTVMMAGKSEFDRSNTAEMCFSSADESNVPPIVARHLAKVHPGPGQRIKAFNDPDVSQETVFGMIQSGTDENSVATLLAPAQKSAFREQIEASQFTSVTAPLGKGRNVKVRHHGPPVSPATMFGITNKFKSSTAECMDGVKDPEDPEQRAVVKAMYTKSHGSFGAGEQRSRGYGGNFSSGTKFGRPTPHSKEGKAFKQTMHWHFDAQAEKSTPLISRRAREYSDKYGGVQYQAALGMPAEPMAGDRGEETWDPGYTFGSKPLEKTDSVHQLMHTHEGLAHQGELAQTRSPLKETAPFYESKEIEFPAVDALEQALTDRDIEANQVASGMLARPVVEELLQAHDAPVSLEELPATGEFVQYQKLVESLRSGSLRVSPSRDLDPAQDVPFAGHPTLRLDLPVQDLKSVSDRTNYGDQGTVGTIMNPDCVTVRGLDERDLMQPRPREQIEQIFNTAGLGATHTFEDVWRAAQDAQGQVSVMSFQMALDA